MSRPEYHWRLEPHVCAICLGRVVSRLVEVAAPVVKPREIPPENGVLPGLEPLARPPKRTPVLGAPSAVVVQRSEFECSNCGVTWVGEAKRGCACGIKLGPRDAGVRCVPNDRPRPELLSKFIAREVS